MAWEAVSIATQKCRMKFDKAIDVKLRRVIMGRLAPGGARRATMKVAPSYTRLGGTRPRIARGVPLWSPPRRASGEAPRPFGRSLRLVANLTTMGPFLLGPLHLHEQRPPDRPSLVARRRQQCPCPRLCTAWPARSAPAGAPVRATA